jgi:predicted esterase
VQEFKRNLNIALPVSYWLRPGSNSELILLLHGYQDKGERLYRNLQKILPVDSTILAPNGIFPLPYKKENQDETAIPRLKLAYGWYFYDSFEKTYHINQAPACQMLQQLVQELFPTPFTKLTIIGFSQGGYLAPFAAASLPQTSKVIIINGEIKVDLLPQKNFSFPIYAIHGKKDELVDPENCRRSFERFLANGNKGEYFLLENSNHFIDEPIRERLLALLK